MQNGYRMANRFITEDILDAYYFNDNYQLQKLVINGEKIIILIIYITLRYIPKEYIPDLIIIICQILRCPN
jgi:hypothetical protein